ncbi:MAG: amidohydrolase family protein [Chloroflexi bacterium]|nr:amidohydrolase family protein [Chloroflexota bacterium]
MPVTDIHAHIIPEGLLEQLAEVGLSNSPTLKPVDDDMLMFELSNGKRYGPIPMGLVDVDQRLRDMDTQGVDVQILGAAPMLFAHGESAEAGAAVSRLTNDAMLAVVAKHPDRFQVFPSLPMQDADAAVTEIERMAAEEAVRGVQIGTNVAGQNFDEPWLDPIWAALERHDLPALLHPWAPLTGADRLGRYHLSNLIGNPLDSTVAIASLTFGGVLQQHPGLRIGIVHGGGYWPYQTGRWDHGFEWRSEAKVNIQIPPSTFYGQIYCDTLTHDRTALRFLGERVGWDHVMIGTDYPFDMAERDPVGELRAIELGDANERAVLEGNVERFLRRAR